MSLSLCRYMYYHLAFTIDTYTNTYDKYAVVIDDSRWLIENNWLHLIEMSSSPTWRGKLYTSYLLTLNESASLYETNIFGKIRFF